MPNQPVLLIVDDDADIREILTITLADEGYDVVTAANGARALDLIAEGVEPHVILLDLMMPVMDGWAFWDRRQATPALRRIPVIILTATGLRTGSIGDALVLPKPVDRAVLLETLHAATTARSEPTVAAST